MRDIGTTKKDIDTMEFYYSTTKKNEMSFSGKGAELEMILLNASSQAPKNKNCTFCLTCEIQNEHCFY